MATTPKPTPKRGRGRPRKDPNDTTTAPYVKKNPYSGVGRPKKNPYEGSGWGGAREGAGIKPYLKPSEKKSETILFMATPATKRRYELLREQGADPAELLRNYLDRIAATRLGADNIPDTWTPPKKKA